MSLRVDLERLVESFMAILVTVLAFIVVALQGLAWAVGYILALGMVASLAYNYIKRRGLRSENLRVAIAKTALRMLLAERGIYIVLFFIGLLLPAIYALGLGVSLGFVVGIVTSPIGVLGVLRLLGYVEKVDLSVRTGG